MEELEVKENGMLVPIENGDLETRVGVCRGVNFASKYHEAYCDGRMSMALMVAMLVLGFVTVLVNLGVILRTVRIIRQGHDKPAFYFIGNLALSDFAIGLYVVIAFLLHLTNRSDLWRQNTCMLQIGVAVTACQETIFTIVLISADKYLYICHGLHYRTIVTRRRVYGALIVSWLLALVVGSLPALGLHVAWVEACERCAFAQVISTSFAIVFFVTSVAVPFVIVVVLYSILLVLALKMQRERYGGSYTGDEAARSSNFRLSFMSKRSRSSTTTTKTTLSSSSSSSSSKASRRKTRRKEMERYKAELKKRDAEGGEGGEGKELKSLKSEGDVLIQGRKAGVSKAPVRVSSVPGVPGGIGEARDTVQDAPGYTESTDSEKFDQKMKTKNSAHTTDNTRTEENFYPEEPPDEELKEENETARSGWRGKQREEDFYLEEPLDGELKEENGIARTEKPTGQQTQEDSYPEERPDEDLKEENGTARTEKQTRQQTQEDSYLEELPDEELKEENGTARRGKRIGQQTQDSYLEELPDEELKEEEEEVKEADRDRRWRFNPSKYMNKVVTETRDKVLFLKKCRAVKTVLLILVSFGATYVPFVVGSLVYSAEQEKRPCLLHLLNTLLYCAVVANSLANPLIYAYGYREFRLKSKKFKGVFARKKTRPYT